ncbi:hypothetical protein ABTE19_20120 [Acinetobacter baumannii]
MRSDERVIKAYLGEE